MLGMIAATPLVACGGKTDTDARPALVLGDQAGLGRARMEAAGALAGAPFAYRWANFTGAAPLLEALNAGAVDTALAGDAPIVLAAAAGVPLRIVAAARSQPAAVAILVPGGSPIGSVADLRGRRVIVSSARGSIAHYLLLGALKEAGLTSADITIGFMGTGEAASAFAAGQLDAWATFGIYQATAEAQGARILRDGRGINSGLGVIAASLPALADPAKRRAIRDYLGRQARANAWAVDYRDEQAAIYARITKVPIAIARVVNRRNDGRLFAPDAAVVASLQAVADRFQAAGVLPAPVRMAALVDTTLFPA